MGFFNKVRTDGATYDGQGEERRGLIDIIQYNGEADDLVWKFPYNNLSIGAQLIVNKSQEAIFVKGGERWNLMPWDTKLRPRGYICERWCGM